MGFFFNDDLTFAVLNTHVNQPFISASFLSLMEGQNPLVLRDSLYRGVVGLGCVQESALQGIPGSQALGWFVQGAEEEGVRQGSWNDWEQGFLWEQTLLSVWKDILGSTFPFGTQHQWQLQQFLSEDEVMVQDWALCKGKQHFAL